MATLAARGPRLVDWVFLDRDGTLNVKPPPGDYVRRPEELRLLPGAAEAIGVLNHVGIQVALATNQRGVALGRMSLEDLEAVHRQLQTLLAAGGARLDEIYVCPHGLDECDCRKPQPGMLLQARRAHPELDFARAAMVGDSASDIETGQTLGLLTVLVGRQADEHSPNSDADHTVEGVLEAARLLAGVIVP